MKTTIDLPDTLVRQARQRALHEGRPLPTPWRHSSNGWRLISFDRDFSSFEPLGLDLWLLQPAP